jgi:hypothetical protein
MPEPAVSTVPRLEGLLGISVKIAAQEALRALL